MSHTPGPWKSDRKIVGWWNGEQPAVRVAYIKTPHTDAPICMVSAGGPNPLQDALLIAAAPDLLAALRAGRDLIESAFAHVSHGGPTRADAEKVLVIVRKAIAKAEETR